MQKIVCFNGPFEKNGYLNNWYIADFIKYGLRFSSVQQYMGFKTIMLFQDAGVDPSKIILKTCGAVSARWLCMKAYWKSFDKTKT